MIRSKELQAAYIDRGMWCKRRFELALRTGEKMAARWHYMRARWSFMAARLHTIRKGE